MKKFPSGKIVYEQKNTNFRSDNFNVPLQIQDTISLTKIHRTISNFF